MKEPDPSAAPPQTPSVVEGTDYGSAERSHIAPVRTFNSDLAEAVREHRGSVVRVAIAEEEAHRREYEEASIKIQRTSPSSSSASCAARRRHRRRRVGI